ncbi:MAG: hypothetical protein ABR615_01675 [Pseudonocardiaceae bacterium]
MRRAAGIEAGVPLVAYVEDGRVVIEPVSNWLIASAATSPPRGPAGAQWWTNSSPTAALKRPARIKRDGRVGHLSGVGLAA